MNFFLTTILSFQSLISPQHYCIDGDVDNRGCFTEESLASFCERLKEYEPSLSFLEGPFEPFYPIRAKFSHQLFIGSGDFPVFIKVGDELELDLLEKALKSKEFSVIKRLESNPFFPKFVTPYYTCRLLLGKEERALFIYPFVAGKTLSEYIRDAYYHRVTIPDLESAFTFAFNAFRKFQLATLKNGEAWLMGDFTVDNVMVSEDKRICFIDFSALGYKRRVNPIEELYNCLNVMIFHYFQNTQYHNTQGLLKSILLSVKRGYLEGANESLCKDWRIIIERYKELYPNLLHEFEGV